MTLDQRAQQAAEGVHAAVDGHPLLLMSAAPAGRQLMPTVLSFASAFAAVVIVGFLMLQTSMFASDDETTDTTVAPSTTTTSTTLPAVTTTVPAALVPELPDTTTPVVGAQPEVDTTPPLLEITSPKNEESFKEKQIAFTGLTEPGAVVMAGPYEADVKEDGAWSIVLILNEGGNRATITATDAAGNIAEASVVVYYDPPVTTTTKPPAEWEFTAFAKYGECAETPPYDEYYGTAAPGTKILVTSEYGSGSTTTNAGGEWWIRVEFPTAPKGKVFSVRVKNETTFEKFFFEFVSLAE